MIYAASSDYSFLRKTENIKIQN